MDVLVDERAHRDWPFESLAVTGTALTYKSLPSESMLKRKMIEAIEFHEQRLPLGASAGA